MKKRYITVALLIWLFSQQVFATVWATSNSANGNCGSHPQNDCAITGYMSAAEYMPHTMPTLVDTDTSAQDKLLMNCDHCSIVCQALIINKTQLLSFNKDQQIFDAQLTDKLLHVFISSVYRPPIPV
ncbi:MAG: hypothetical protein V7784_15970 [Oceanospirillaceae bacterium]